MWRFWCACEYSNDNAQQGLMLKSHIYKTQHPKSRRPGFEFISFPTSCICQFGIKWWQFVYIWFRVFLYDILQNSHKAVSALRSFLVTYIWDRWTCSKFKENVASMVKVRRKILNYITIMFVWEVNWAPTIHQITNLARNVQYEKHVKVNLTFTCSNIISFNSSFEFQIEFKMCFYSLYCK